jgi:hypothetical protein
MQAWTMASQMLLDGERTSGQDVRTANVTAAMAIANIVKSSLGPVGLDKMLVGGPDHDERRAPRDASCLSCSYTGDVDLESGGTSIAFCVVWWYPGT